MNVPTKYVKKPVEIHALQFIYSPQGLGALREFCGDNLLNYGKDRSPTAKGWAHIGTLEDGNNGQVKHFATEGDFIIRGVNGEFYPCKPDIFHKTYDVVVN